MGLVRELRALREEIKKLRETQERHMKGKIKHMTSITPQLRRGLNNELKRDRPGGR